MSELTATLRVLEPFPGLLAFYDGRIPGKRLHSQARNWMDDGAYGLGIASYALLCGEKALVYDTHISPAHAGRIRRHLAERGVRQIEVVLSHWHTDHIAGISAFADCTIIANPLTALAMIENEAALAAKDPPIHPLVPPNKLFDNRLEMTVGSRTVHLLQFDIHSADGTVLWMPQERLLLAGDTLEDTVTYVSEPEGIARHIEELGRLSVLPVDRILPNHGSEAVIAAGGYGTDLIQANRAYLRRLQSRIDDPALETESLEAFVAPEIAAGSIGYFAPYEQVHRDNIRTLRHSLGAEA